MDYLRLERKFQCKILLHLQFWTVKISVYFGIISSDVAREKISLLMLFNLPNNSQVNRQNSTSSLLSFLRRKNDREMFPLILYRSKHLIYSSTEHNLSLLLIENETGRPDAETHMTHTQYRFPAFFCTVKPSLVSSCYRGRTFTLFSVHFLKKNTTNRIEYLTWTLTKNHPCKTGPEMRVTCGKAAHAKGV